MAAGLSGDLSLSSEPSRYYLHCSAVLHEAVSTEPLLDVVCLLCFIFLSRLHFPGNIVVCSLSVCGLGSRLRATES